MSKPRSGAWTLAGLMMTGLVLTLPPPAAATAHEQLHQLFAEEWETRLRENPLFASYIGDHRYDDRLPEVGEAAMAARAATLRGFQERLAAIDRAQLEPADRLNRDVFAQMLAQELASIEHKDYFFPFTNREGFHVDLVRLPEQTRFANVRDYESYLARLAAVPRYFEQHVELLRQAIAAGYVQPRVVLEGFDESIRAHAVTDPETSLFYAPFKSFPDAVPESERERLRAAGRRAVEEVAVPTYRNFLKFFLEEYLPACRESLGASELPAGRAFYAHRVRLGTSLDTTAEKVHEVGLAEVARIRAEMEAVVREVKFEGSFAEFLTFLRTDPRFYVETPEALLKEAALISKRMDGELPRLFRRLPRLPYGLKEIPDYLAPKTTAAYYSQGAGDGTRAGTYFLNLSNLKSRPLYALEALSFHEAVPGHHLQLALAQELEELPMFRRFFDITAFVEGWALYSERLGLEVGFYKDPYSNFGRLTYEMWRACRLVVDTGLHVMGWSRQQALDYLGGNTALSLHEVTTEIDRYIAWPGQALGYKMGELEIRRLRKKAETELGEKFDVREFHEVVLKNGSLPLGVLASEVEAWIAQASAKPAS